MTVFIFLNIIGIILILKGIKDSFTTLKESFKKKVHFNLCINSILKSSYYFLTGGYLMYFQNLEMQLHQLYLLGVFYFGMSTIFWLILNRIEKEE